MAGGEPDEETMRAYAAAQQRLEAGGGYRWRDDVLSVLGGLGFDEEAAGRRLSTFSGGELTRASLARALAYPARPAAARRADQPSRHPLAGVAGALPGRPRRGRRPRRPRPLVPRGGGHLGAGAGGAARPLLRRALARLAQGTGGARDRSRQGDRAPAGGDRADGALRRALPLQGDQGAPGAVAAEADRQDQARRRQGRTARPAQPALLLRQTRATGPHRAQTRQRDDRGPGPHPALRGRPRTRTRRARRPGRRPTAPARRP